MLLREQRFCGVFGLLKAVLPVVWLLVVSGRRWRVDIGGALRGSAAR